MMQAFSTRLPLWLECLSGSMRASSAVKFETIIFTVASVTNSLDCKAAVPYLWCLDFL